MLALEVQGLKTRLLFERFFMALSRRRSVDGLWLYVLDDKKSGELALDRIETALGLIKTYDAMRYRRVLRDVEKIQIFPLIGAQGQFCFERKQCTLDYKYVESATPEAIASTIVHEATHGHVWLRMLGYPEALRHRIEQICFRQQLLFLKKLPAGEDDSAGVERNISRPVSFWSDKGFADRWEDEALRAGKSYGVPRWVMRMGFRVNKLRSMVLRIRYFGQSKK